MVEQGLDKAAIFARSGQTLGVNDASFEVNQGEIFVVSGLSGSGKSTLVRCMTGLVDTTRGGLLIDDDNLAGIEARRLIDIRRHKISMVFQDFALLPHLTVLENIAFPLRVQGMGRQKGERFGAAFLAVLQDAG